MGLFTRKKNRVEMEAYYIIDDNLYMFRKVEFLTEKESNLTRDEFFNKYGFYIRKYDLEYDSFDVWYITHCHSMEENPFDMTNAVEVNEEDLEDAIETIKKACEKKFNDFELNETLYTYNKYPDIDSTFPPVAKVRKKLINKQAENIVQQLLLEIEVLDGQEGHTKREFITFYDFINDYDEGCPIKVIDSNGDYENSIDDFFW